MYLFQQEKHTIMQKQNTKIHENNVTKLSQFTPGILFVKIQSVFFFPMSYQGFTIYTHDRNSQRDQKNTPKSWRPVSTTTRYKKREHETRQK